MILRKFSIPSLKRIKTKYPGVYFVTGKFPSRSGKSERVYYIRYRKGGKEIEEKAGGHLKDAMTAAKAARIRAECIDGMRRCLSETRDCGRDQKNSKVQECKGLNDKFNGIEQGEQSHEVMTASEENFRAFFETATDLMCMVDKNGVLTYVNESTTKTLGYSKEDIIGMHIKKLLDKTDTEKRFLSTFKKIIKRGNLALETTWITKNGTKLHGEERLVAVHDSNGRFVGVRGVLRDITQRKMAELSLKKREAELDLKNRELEEMNAALRVLLKRRDEDKNEIEEKVLLNIQELVMPYLKKIQKTKLDAKQESFVKVLESNLKDISSPFARVLSTRFLKFTPTEIQVASLVKHGRSTKEIADLLNLSSETIECHRKNIRNKIGIKNKNENLRTHLLAFHAG